MVDPNTAATLTLGQIGELCDAMVEAHGDCCIPRCARRSRGGSVPLGACLPHAVLALAAHAAAGSATAPSESALTPPTAAARRRRRRSAGARRHPAAGFVAAAAGRRPVLRPATTGRCPPGWARPRTPASSARTTPGGPRQGPLGRPVVATDPAAGAARSTSLAPGRRRACPSSRSTSSSPSPGRSGCGCSPAATTGRRPGWSRSATSGVRHGLRRTAAPADLERLRLDGAARHLPPLFVDTGLAADPGCGSSTCRARSPGRVRLRDDQLGGPARATSTRRPTSRGTTHAGATWRPLRAGRGQARLHRRGLPLGTVRQGRRPARHQAVRPGWASGPGSPRSPTSTSTRHPPTGRTILPDGHMVVDETLPVHDGRTWSPPRTSATSTAGSRPGTSATSCAQSNLKALQLRMNWVYVVPGVLPGRVPRALGLGAAVLGQTAPTSPDAWAALRDAEDTYWGKDSGEGDGPFTSAAAWRHRPWVRNLERWLVQTDVPGAVAHRSDVDVRTGDPVPENGTAHEGLRTSVRDGDTALAFRLDPGFLGSDQHDVVVKVTYSDSGSGGFTVEVFRCDQQRRAARRRRGLGERHRVPRGRHCGLVAGRGRRPAPGAGRRGG